MSHRNYGLRPRALPPLVQADRPRPLSRSEATRIAITAAVVLALIGFAYWPLVRRWIGS